MGVFVIFAPTFFFEFIALDDSKHIWSNNYVMYLSWDHLKFFWEQPYYGLYIPIVYNLWTFVAALTQSLNFEHPISGISAHLFHTTNVVFHLANAFVVYQLAGWFVSQSLEDGQDGWEFPAFFAAAVFAFHPLQVEAVAWVSGLKDVLSSFFALVSFYFFLRSRGTENDSSKNKKRPKGRSSQMVIRPLLFSWPAKVKHPLIMSFVFFLLAVLCKPNTVVLPAAFLVVTLWQTQSLKQCLRLGPFFVAVLPIVYVTKNLQPNARLDFTLEFWQYPLIALHAVGFYIQKFFLPFSLAPDYGLSPSVALNHTLFWPLAFLGLAMLVLTLFLFVKKNSIWVPLSLIWIGLFPVLGFVPFEYQNMSTVADRYTYLLPMWGFSWALTLQVRRLSKDSGLWSAGVVAGALVILSFLQTQNWKTSERLFTQTLKVNPNSYVSLNNMGLVKLRTDQFADSEKYFLESLKIKPDYTAAQSNLGVVYFKQKKYDRVIEHYTAVLKDHPNLTAGASATFADMHYNLGAALLNMGNLQQSLIHLNKASEINVNHYSAQFNRGRVYAHMKDLENAKKAYLQAYRINPNSAEVVDELKKLQAQGVKF